MKISTYWWNNRVVSPWKLNIRKAIFRDGYKYFSVGNAGDILVRDIVRDQYESEPINIDNAGSRLLLVGSVSHRVRDGDVLCGIGTQGKASSLTKKNDVTIIGLRGPITYDEFKVKGYDMSQVRFLMDPGLMVRFMFANDEINPRSGSVAFIPHYKERAIYKNLRKGIDVIDIDDSPANVCRKILEAEHIFSSSLHGIIFSHALGRPATLVEPKTESLLKYKDYYASVGLEFPVPIRDIENHNMAGLKTSPEHIKYCRDDFVFPEISLLKEKGVACYF